MRNILILGLLFISNLSAQNYYTFTELKGIEDQLNNTQLFYRKFTSGYDSTVGYYYSNSIYHLDPVMEIDTLLLIDGGFGDWFNEINDYDFWKNDYQKYIYAGTDISTEGTPKVYRYDQSEPVFVSTMWGSSRNIEISRQDTNLIFAIFDYGINFKSTDWGNTWDTLAYGYEILSVSPFNDSVIFASQSLTLFKSTDGGNSFQTVDTGRIYLNNFLYDSDGIHIYTLDRKYGNHLIVSDDNGEPFSWTERYSSTNQIYVSIDYSQSGSIYLADGRNIYHSTDYGITFNEYKVLDRRIVGIYKKPGSDKLYAVTKYDLYEITLDTIITLKHLIPNPGIFSWYPLKIGDIWVYELTVEIYASRFAIEVVDDTLIAGKYYYKIKRYSLSNTNYYYERIDTSNGKVYRYASGVEDCIYDFTAETAGDTVLFKEDNDYIIGWVLEYDEPFSQWGLNSTKRIFSAVIPTSGYNLYSFVKDVGLYRNEGGEVLYSSSVLKGFVSGGIVFGDISLVDVDDDKELLKEFSLSQNYPNPFNPTTKIKFVIPNSSFVNLKVYDVLGREVTTLVNEEKPAGEYEVEFSGKNLSSGVYYYQLKADNYVETKKMLFIK